MMNIAQMLFNGPTLKENPHGHTAAHLLKYSEQMAAEASEKVLIALSNRKMTSKEISEAINYRSASAMSAYLRKMARRGLIKEAGRTKGAQKLRSKIIWENVQ